MAKDDTSSFKQAPPPPGVWSQWWAEIITCMLMIGLLCALVGILSPYDGKPLPDWPFHVSINAVVSVLSTVMKACAVYIIAEGISDTKWRWFQNSRPLHDLLVFDNASRGPWGCLSLLVAPRGMHPISSLGAALVILSLALDPFTQQLIRYSDCKQVSTKKNATLPRSTTYCEKGPADNESTRFSPIATPFLGFINQAIYNPADVKTPVVCATGNCTFDHSFSTLGFCSECKDLSSHLTFEDRTTTSSYPNLLINETITSLPSGSYTVVSTGRNAYVGKSYYFVMNPTTDGRTDIIQAFVGPDGPLAASNTRCKATYENKTWSCSGLGGAGAARCKFSPCVKTYRARVEQGQLQEELIHAQLDMLVVGYGTGYYFLAADLSCAGPEAVSQLQEAGFRIGKDDRIIPWSVMTNKRITSDGNANIWAGESYGNVSVPGPLLNETSLPLDIIPEACLYSMCFDAEFSIVTYLSAYLHGNITGLSSTDGPPQIRAIYNDSQASFDSINQTFDRIAEGITQRIRRYEDPKVLPVAEPAIGVMWEQKTCVSVRWPYLAFPIAVVTLTTVFLFAVVGKAAFGKTNNMIAAGWKSSPLPLAFHGLTTDGSVQEGTDEGYTGYTRSLTEMERVAKTTKARLKM
ncbi:hypothetical protein PG990_008645 [Apiospora arundinis]